MIASMCIVPVSAETIDVHDTRIRGAVPEYYYGETWERIAKAKAPPTVTVVGGEGILPKYCISEKIKEWATVD